MALIAGHRFEQTANGRCCTFSNNEGGVCYRRWVDIRWTTKEDVGQSGIAHNGYLTAVECFEIEMENNREQADIWLTIIDSASSGSR